MIEKISKIVFEAPEKWMHVREAARKLKISPNSVRKHLKVMKKKGIVEEKREGAMLRFRANMQNENYRRNKMIDNLRAIYDSGIVDFLSEYYIPNAIVLFGSYSRGEDSSTSDIDIAVLTGIGKRPDLREFEKKLSRRIELSLFERKNVSKEFFNNLVNGIVLKGFLKNE